MAAPRALRSLPLLLGSLLALLACAPSSGARAATLLVSHYSGTLYTLTLTGNSSSSSGSAQLAITSQLRAGGTMPSWLTLDSESRTVYVTDEAGFSGSASLTQLSVSATDGTMRVTGVARTTGGELHSGLYGEKGGFIAVAEYDASTVTTYKLPLSSSSTQIQKLRFTMSGRGRVPARQDRPHPHSVFADPTGRFLLSTDLGADVIRIFSVDSSTGRLTDCPAAAAAPGDGPRHAEFWRSADKNITLLYVLNELSNSVGTYSVTYPATGGGCLTLKRESSISTYPAGKSAPNGSKAAEIHVSPDGRFVYASNRNDQSFGSRTDSMAGYSIDPATGRLTWLEASSAYSYFPRTFSINAAGDMVAIGGQTSANVAVVRRDVATGKLGPLIASIRVGNQGTVNSEDGLSAVVWNE